MQQLPEHTETKQISQFAQEILKRLICYSKDNNMPSFVTPKFNLMKVDDSPDNSTSTSLIVTFEHMIHQLEIC